MTTPDAAYRWWFKDPMTKIVFKGTLGKIGVKNLRWRNYAGIDMKTDAERQQMLNATETYFATRLPTPPNLPDVAAQSMSAGVGGAGAPRASPSDCPVPSGIIVVPVLCRSRGGRPPGGRMGRVADDASAPWDAEAETFDDAADHGLRDPAVRRAWADFLLPLVNGRGLRVADLGCGTGTLSLLLAAEGGHFVSGVDFSSEMIRRAREKTELTIPKPVFTVADAAKPPLRAGSFDVVLSRHVLWAMPDPAAALEKWIELLTPTGVLILIEGRWHTGVGLTADECFQLVSDQRQDVQLRMLDDPSYWGGRTADERYLIISPS